MEGLNKIYSYYKISGVIWVQRIENVTMDLMAHLADLKKICFPMSILTIYRCSVSFTSFFLFVEIRRWFCVKSDSNFSFFLPFFPAFFQIAYSYWLPINNQGWIYYNVTFEKICAFSPTGVWRLNPIWIISSMQFDILRENICLIFIYSFLVISFYGLEKTYVKVLIIKKLLT